MKLKRIFALLGTIILAGLYLCTLIFSLMSGELALGLFRASIFCTVAIPILLYVYMTVYKVLRGRGVPKEDRKPGDTTGDSAAKSTQKNK